MKPWRIKAIENPSAAIRGTHNPLYVICEGREKMKKFFATALFLLLGLPNVTFASGVIHTATITDGKNQKVCLTEIKSRAGHKFILRRGNESLEMDFKKIKSIEFATEEGNPSRNYRPAKVTFINGKTSDLYMKVSYNCYGIVQPYWITGTEKDDLTNTCRLDPRKIRTIEFQHDGLARVCSICETVFYNSDLYECPFDKNVLIASQ